MEKGLAALKAAVEAKMVDDFEVGTVIRWKSSGTYDYAALKASNGLWYTTAASYNTFVSQSLDFDGLIEVLSRAETTDIAVATEFTAL